MYFFPSKCFEFESIKINRLSKTQSSLIRIHPQHSIISIFGIRMSHSSHISRLINLVNEWTPPHPPTASTPLHYWSANNQSALCVLSSAGDQKGGGLACSVGGPEGAPYQGPTAGCSSTFTDTLLQGQEQRHTSSTMPQLQNMPLYIHQDEQSDHTHLPQPPPFTLAFNLPSGLH